MLEGLPFDPLQRSLEMEKRVMNRENRLYSKFRAAPYYGGIATADAIGCSFLCAYCWNYARNEDPSRYGKSYSPEEVGARLLEISRRHRLHRFRITGSEPILGQASLGHLLRVVEMVFQESPGAEFILETNGLMLGYREDFADRLKFYNLLVRIALKGVDTFSFEKISGAQREFFAFPLRALKNLESLGVRAWPALMEDFFDQEEINGLKRILQDHRIRAKLELERLERYPYVLENMRRRGI